MYKSTSTDYLWISEFYVDSARNVVLYKQNERLFRFKTYADTGAGGAGPDVGNQITPNAGRVSAGAVVNTTYTIYPVPTTARRMWLKVWLSLTNAMGGTYVRGYCSLSQTSSLTPELNTYFSCTGGAYVTVLDQVVDFDSGDTVNCNLDCGSAAGAPNLVLKLWAHSYEV
jgi:hypothetical protein